MKKRVKKTKSGVPVKYLLGSQNKRKAEREILETRKKYAAGKKIDLKRVERIRTQKK
jgi:hypothetical protein|tara:strand:+ start:1056 stop:1226 length:171 start_codon:yes stop_codon:yes gene_type:complete